MLLREGGETHKVGLTGEGVGGGGRPVPPSPKSTTGQCF